MEHPFLPALMGALRVSLSSSTRWPWEQLSLCHSLCHPLCPCLARWQEVTPAVRSLYAQPQHTAGAPLRSPSSLAVLLPPSPSLQRTGKPAQLQLLVLPAPLPHWSLLMKTGCWGCSRWLRLNPKPCQFSYLIFRPWQQF